MNPQTAVKEESGTHVDQPQSERTTAIDAESLAALNLLTAEAQAMGLYEVKRD
jgi:hypothetical protein